VRDRAGRASVVACKLMRSQTDTCPPVVQKINSNSSALTFLLAPTCFHAGRTGRRGATLRWERFGRTRVDSVSSSESSEHLPIYRCNQVDSGCWAGELNSQVGVHEVHSFWITMHGGLNIDKIYGGLRLRTDPNEEGRCMEENALWGGERGVGRT
jgi:hypothetical protein